MITIFKKRMWAVLLVLMSLTSLLGASEPVLRIPGGLSWKDVFDSGFRPKHLPGLERVTCVALDSKFYLRMGEDGNFFFCDTGRLSFDLDSNDEIAVFWHQERNPITLQEGGARLVAFREFIGKDNLKYPGKIPPVIEEQFGSINADSNFHARAKVGQYWIMYGFSASSNREKPIIPQLHIGLTPPKGDSTPPVRRKVVEPPEGYEWYSLNPAIDTPAPGIRRPVQTASEEMAAAIAVDRSIRVENEKLEITATAKKSFPWVVAVVLAAFGVVAVVMRNRRVRQG